ncbi:IclR family transcriptional regulator [Leucothrix mucor]|uniref:IclR family transcriptional regulator n=1 Tax=Leucothrix mucor TaxID=45248 RepID=UPI0003B48218|nr:IclR family transcriptional regulator [Leucothrix mucor]
MKTVDKAVKLLNLFSVSQPEIGLSELARMANYDKAATRRFLVALQNHQFIEQNSETKAYRLGIGFIHLAKVREATMPLEVVIQPALTRLMERTNETSHGSLMVNGNLSSIGISFPARGNRAHLELGEILPLHATASGIVFQAFSGGIKLDDLSAYTDSTTTDPDKLTQIITETRQRGYAVASGFYCNEVTGMATPYFDANGKPMGCIAVATPSSRLTNDLQQIIQNALFTEAQYITKAIGGKIPPSYQSFISSLEEHAA